MAKVRIMPDNVAESHELATKGGDRVTGLPVLERPMSYQVVGEVMAHQAYDG